MLLSNYTSCILKLYNFHNKLNNLIITERSTRFDLLPILLIVPNTQMKYL